jgi:hypothetical protein
MREEKNNIRRWSEVMFFLTYAFLIATMVLIENSSESVIKFQVFGKEWN